jgi:VanZ family protein
LFGLSSFWVEILGHLVCFGVLGWLLGRSMRVLGVKRPALVAVGLSTLFGAALEVGQIWIPGRGFQILDLVTNLLGAVVGAWLSRAAGRAKAQ